MARLGLHRAFALGRLAQCAKGLAAVEFAVAMPLLIALYLGTVQLTDAVAAKRKLAVTTRSLADLTTQYTSLSTSEADSVLNAATQVMAPFSTAPGTYTVSQVYVNGSGGASIVWSRSRNGTARAVGSGITLPTGIALNDSYVILAESSYQYSPGFTKNLLPAFTMSESIYMYPRRSNKVDMQ